MPPLSPPLPPVVPRSACSLRALFFGFGASSTNKVSSGSESGRMKYLISLPLTLMWSRLICTPPFGVIFAVRRLVFICGETEAMVPWMIVPVDSSQDPSNRQYSIYPSAHAPDGVGHTGLQLDCNSLVRALHQKPTMQCFVSQARCGRGLQGNRSALRCACFAQRLGRLT